MVNPKFVTYEALHCIEASSLLSIERRVQLVRNFIDKISFIAFISIFGMHLLSKKLRYFERRKVVTICALGYVGDQNNMK